MPITEPVSEPTFIGSVARQLTELQSSVAKMIEPVLGDRKPTAIGLARSLGIEKTLAWKFWKIVEEPDPLRTFNYLPGDAGCEIFLKASEHAGARPELVARTRDALQGVRGLVEGHAQDREGFELLLAGHQDPDALREISLQQRKAAMKANSFIWGVRTKVHYSAGIIGASGDPAWLESCRLSGFVQFQRVRPEASWMLCRRIAIEHDSPSVESEHPLDELLNPDTPPFLHKFITQPPPALVLENNPGGPRNWILRGGNVGKSGEFTIFFGEHKRIAFAPVKATDGIVGMLMHTPAQVAVIDAVMDTRIFGETSPTAGLYSDLGIDPDVRFKFDREQMRSVDIRLDSLGRGIECARSRDLPVIPELLQHAIQRMGWNPSDFAVHRLRIEYPPIPSSGVMRFAGHSLLTPPASRGH